MALLTTQQVTITGTAITFGAAAASDTVKADGRTMLVYKNTNAATRDITVVVPGARFGQNNPDVVRTIAATTGEAYIGPLTRDLADATTGLVTVTLSATAGVTVAAVRV